MEIKVLEKIDEEEWDSAVHKYGTSVTQLHFFSEIYRSKGMKVLYIAAYENGELIGGAPLFEKKGFPEKMISISPFGNNHKTAAKIIEVLKKELKRHFINYLILENDDPNANLYSDFISEKKATVIVRLDKTLDELKKNLDKKARWGVKKATEQGLFVKPAETKQEWKEFYKIYSETCKRDGISPIPYSELELIREKISEKACGTLLLVRKEKKIIAGSLLYHFKDASTHSLNGSRKKYLELQPNNLLYWAMIEFSKEKGMKRFNLGGYALDAREGTTLYGINRFKMRWGGELVHFNTYSTSRLYFPLIRLLKKTGILK